MVASDSEMVISVGEGVVAMVGAGIVVVCLGVQLSGEGVVTVVINVGLSVDVVDGTGVSALRPAFS